MIEVRRENDDYIFRIPKEYITDEFYRELLERVDLEMKLSQTKIENSLKEISEELKEGWWYNNKNRILKQNGITPKNQIDEENNS